MTAAQLALGWLLQKEPWIVSIPVTGDRYNAEQQKQVRF